MERVGCDVICKSHSARSDRDHYHICPTKLSKQELEDLYYALFEDNLQLKKTINGQQDRIKVLSTKVQRITSAQNVVRAEEKRGCCAATKAIVKQQKEMITELKRSNERMAERIRKLNMRLCSAKQFCKSATPRCLRCSTATSPYLIKHSARSYKQQSQSTLKLAVSCQNLSRDSMITKCVQTEPCLTAKHKDDKRPCEDNKCRTLLDELKQKIVSLQEELSASRAQCSRASAAERQLHSARSERVAAEHELQHTEQRNAFLVTTLRSAEGLATELKTQLSIERRKVAELETRLRAATMSNRVTKTIADTLTSIQESNKPTPVDVTLSCACSPRGHYTDLNAQKCPRLSPKGGHYLDETKLSRSIDDSGYIDASKSQSFLDDQSLNKIIEELTKRILVLQTQVDALTISPPELDITAASVVEHSASTQNHSSVLTDAGSLPVQTTNGRITPPEVFIEPCKDSQDQSEDQTLDNDPKLATNATKAASSKNNQYNSLQIPSLAIGQSGWETGVAKLAVVAKVTKEKDNVKTAKVNKEKNNGKAEEESNDAGQHKHKNIDQDETSISSEEKTYNVPEKVKNFTEIDKNAADINKNTNEKYDDIPEKTKNGHHKHRVKKQKSTPEKETNGMKAEKKIAVRSQTVKQGSHDKATTQNDVDTTKILSVDTAEARKKSNEKASDAINMPEKKKQITRSKTLARSETVNQNTSTCEEATYTVECETSTRATSPDNTDYEISSMTDLSDEREPKSPSKSRLSPGEHKFASIRSDSLTLPSTNYSLSEGEIPITTVRRKSNGDNPDLGLKSTAPKMEETLQAITDELTRCKRLLHSQRSQESVPALT